MKPKTSTSLVAFEEKLFDIKDEPIPEGAWWWWFWLFFFDNPQNPKKPRQLMILWSTKNVDEIDCNDLHIKLKRPLDKTCLDGAAAAWYYDGETMHHNFVLEQCELTITPKGLTAKGKTPSSFSVEGTTNTVRVGEAMEFVAEGRGTHDFTLPSHSEDTYAAGKGYSILKLNHLDLTGKVDGEKITGSAYFQRVFVNAPVPQWYWGVIHFEAGAVLTYFNPRLFGLNLNKEVSFFDGKKLHRFFDIRVTRAGESETPTFEIEARDGEKKLSFHVDAYAHSSWTFKKKALGILPNTLIYNEYPATVSNFRFQNGNEVVTGDEFGASVGNAEHTTGFLL